jgi:hypothetical protein
VSVPADVDGPTVLAVHRLTRPELIDLLLDLNRDATFQFTQPWLRKQWTARLRALATTALRHRPPQPARTDLTALPPAAG